VSYLLLVQSAKWAFYRVWPPERRAPAPHLRSHPPLIRGGRLSLLRPVRQSMDACRRKVILLEPAVRDA
jgi:hypothetical protein